MLRNAIKLDLLVTLGALVLLAYLGWHGLQGPRGYSYLATLTGRVTTLQAELQSETDILSKLESKVALMRPEAVDPDMLEELARSQLELSRPNELVVRYGAQKP